MQSQKKVETGKTGQSGATPGGDSGQRKEGGREKGGVVTKTDVQQIISEVRYGRRNRNLTDDQVCVL